MNKHFEGKLPCQGALQQTAKKKKNPTKTPNTAGAALGGVNSQVDNLKFVWNHRQGEKESASEKGRHLVKGGSSTLTLNKCQDFYAVSQSRKFFCVLLQKVGNMYLPEPEELLGCELYPACRIANVGI